MPKSPTKIQPAYENRDLAAALAVQRVLTEGRAEIQRQIDAIITAGYLRANPNDPKADRLRQRLAALKVPPRAPPPDAADEPALPATVALALAVVHGNKPAPSASDAVRLAELRADLDRVDDGIRAQHEVLARIKDELAQHVADLVRDEQRARVLKVYRALQAFSAAVDEEIALTREVQAAGYAWRGDLLPGSSLRAGVIAGSEARWDSEVSQLRRRLEAAGIL